MIRVKYGAVIGHTVAHTVVSEMLAPNGQSQRHVSPFSSNHGFSPNDSVNYSDWSLPPTGAMCNAGRWVSNSPPYPLRTRAESTTLWRRANSRKIAAPGRRGAGVPGRRGAGAPGRWIQELKRVTGRSKHRGATTPLRRDRNHSLKSRQERDSKENVAMS